MAKFFATAPYNFVSLPEKPLPSEIGGVKSFSEHIQSRGNLSGEIILNIEALTPLFIGGNLADTAKSFAPLGEPIIAGSSLRGMFKNIFKIVTCGNFRGKTDAQRKGEDFNDEHIYYRCIMKINSLPWTRDLNALYNGRMISNMRGADGKMHPVKNARPGFLIRTADNKFYISPATHSDNRILITEYEKTFNERVKIRGDSHIAWHGKDAYIITGSQPPFKLYDKKSYEKLTGEQKKKAGKQFIRYTSIDYVDWNAAHWLEISDEVRESYEHDRNRRGVNLFKAKGILDRAEVEELTGKTLPNLKTLVPCHYLEEGGRVTAFGHGQCFRIPYEKSIGDVVPKSLQGGTIDFADAIFGYEKFWASRVCFEDAVPVTEIRTLEKSAVHPLMQPNPTSYQLYLRQDLSAENLNHWDKVNAQIRGYKMYWHCGFADWKATEAEKNLDVGKASDKRMTKDLTPLARGAKFQSKICFKNLSVIELGALMMIFDLNGAQNIAYKIGQGKPLGFGSVKITPQLFIESETAYTEIFDADGWKNPYRAEPAAKYLAAFKNYLAEKNMLEAWEKIMQELNVILDWSKTKQKNWLDKVKPMRGEYRDGRIELDDRFKFRNSLPSILEIVK